MLVRVQPLGGGTARSLAYYAHIIIQDVIIIRNFDESRDRIIIVTIHRPGHTYVRIIINRRRLYNIILLQSICCASHVQCIINATTCSRLKRPLQLGAARVCIIICAVKHTCSIILCTLLPRIICTR